MKNNTSKQRPAYRIYSVNKHDGKTVWTEIGAAWPHKDGQGFGFHFTARPLDGSELVLRAAKEKGKPAADAFAG